MCVLSLITILHCTLRSKNGFCYMHWKGCDQPTQTLYHIPAPVLKPKGNLVVLFEEAATEGARNLSSVALVALTEHPA